MFDDEEENQDQPKPSSARLRFSNWLVGLDPDSGMPPGTPPADGIQTWQELQAKTPFNGQRLMQPDAVSGQSGRRQPYSATRPGNLAQSRPPLQRQPRIKPKLSIGERLMQMDLDAASGKRTGIPPKLTLGQRLMGLDGSEGFRVDNPLARQGTVNGSVPTASRWSRDGQTSFARGQQAVSIPRPTGSASIVDMTARTKTPSRIPRPAASWDVKPNPVLKGSGPDQQTTALGRLMRGIGGPETVPMGVSPSGSLIRDVTYRRKVPSRIPLPAVARDVKPNPNLNLSDPEQQTAALGSVMRGIGGPETAPIGCISSWVANA